MVSITKIIGGPGTGKTTRAMRIIESLGELGIPPIEIGFSSFTKAARHTAATRAAERFGYDPNDLMSQGWYRTLHAVCYQMLRVNSKQMLSDSKASQEWLSNVFGEKVEATAVDLETGFPVLGTGSSSQVSAVLAWWGLCRNALAPVAKMTRYAPLLQGGIGHAVTIVEQYERHKRLDDKLDFADLPLRVAGLRHDIHEITRVTPQGDPPAVRAWILDEYQDTFPSIHAAAQRIVSHPDVEHVYALGDPYQSIFGFSAGNPRFLMGGWNYTAEEVLRQSFRCPPSVMQLAEKTIRACSDYFDRQILPRADASGGVTSMSIVPTGPSRPVHGDWLFIARTNTQAVALGRWLSKGNVPWRSTIGGAYLGPKQRAIAKALLSLHEGKFITKHEWILLAGNIQAISGGRPLLARGFKSEVAAGSYPENMPDELSAEALPKFGGTDDLVAQLRSPNWKYVYKQFDKIDTFVAAARAYGVKAASDPQAKVGTIHSVKGDEASNVMLYDALTKTCRTNLYASDRSSADEELRVWYVGVTRARDRLITARFPRDEAVMYRHV